MDRPDGPASASRPDRHQAPELHDGEFVASHGRAKRAEPTDPLDLVGTMVPGGDIDALGRCFIEEFAAMGYGAEQIFSLFRDPQYVALHPVLRIKGEDAVRRMIEQVLTECGVFRVTETISESPRRCPKLVQIELPRSSGKDEQP